MGLVSSSGGTASASTTTNTSFSLTPTRNAGDLVIVHCHLGVENASITEPSGWTVGYDPGGAAPEAGTTVGVWYKHIAANESGSLSWTWSTGSSYVAGCLRFNSNAGNQVKLSQFTSGSTTTDNASPYTTPSITITHSNISWIAAGISSEGSNATTFSSNDAGDQRRISLSNAETSEENVAMFSSDQAETGSVNRVLTSSSNTMFQALYWIAEITEVTWPRSLVVDKAAMIRSYYW